MLEETANSQQVFGTTAQRILDRYNQATNGDLPQPIDQNTLLEVPFLDKQEKALLAEALKQQIFATACGLPKDYCDIPGPYIKGIFRVCPEDIEDFANDDNPAFTISKQDGESESGNKDPSLDTKANSTDDEQSQTDNDDEDDSSSNESDSDNDSQMSSE
jgi:hypothetical protein